METVIRKKLERIVSSWDMHVCLVLLVGSAAAVVFVAVFGVRRWQQLNKGNEKKVCFVVCPSLSLSLFYYQNPKSEPTNTHHPHLVPILNLLSQRRQKRPSTLPPLQQQKR